MIFSECHYAQCCYAECRYAECRNAQSRYAECHYAECRYAECRGALFQIFFLSFYCGELKKLVQTIFFLEPNRCLSFNSIKIFERFERMAETAAKT